MGLVYPAQHNAEQAGNVVRIESFYVRDIIKENTKSSSVRIICRRVQGFGITPSEFFDFSKITETLLDDE